MSEFKKVCKECKVCVLELTRGICPKKGCPKGMMNAPCGGYADGICEVSKTRKCIWVSIYERLREDGRVDEFVGSYFEPNKENGN